MPKLACFHDTASFGARNGLAADSRMAGVTATPCVAPISSAKQSTEAVAIFNADLPKFLSIYAAIYPGVKAD
jgi:hypothetical protein